VDAGWLEETLDAQLSVQGWGLGGWRRSWIHNFLSRGGLHDFLSTRVSPLHAHGH
jgi:hypothetical protein